jgi:hypothetical protein
MELPMKTKVKLFLDSGAFSAFTKGVTIDIQEYISFIKQYQNYIEVYANLDVIGFPEATLQNQKIMEKAGLSPLPCFHYGEDIKYLKYYIENYKYIALGGMVPISSKDLSVWLDKLFSDYVPETTKVHGFGLTSLKLMIRYPWYSVDSTSWCITGRMGSVYVPRLISGKYIYDKDSWKVSVSSRSPDKKEAGKHIDTFSPLQKQEIINYFESRGYILGKSEFDVIPANSELEENERWFGKKRFDGTREVEKIIEPGLCNTYQLRDELNITYFMDLEKSLPKWPWKFKLKSNKGFGF